MESGKTAAGGFFGSKTPTTGRKGKDILLVLDVGNTTVVLGVFDGDRLVRQWRLTSDRRTSDEIGMILLSLMRSAGIEPALIHGAILGSVVPPLDSVIVEAIDIYFHSPCLRVDTSLDLGIEVRYATPKEIGADRLINAVAGKSKYGHPVIVVDFGTAITLDVVSPDGAYLGGTISPGIVTSMEALFGRTAKLPKIALEIPSVAIGRTTVEAIQSGILFGTAGLVDALVRRIERELGCRVTVVATGGHCSLVASASETIGHVDPELTLDGLRMIYERNSGSVARPR